MVYLLIKDAKSTVCLIWLASMQILSICRTVAFVVALIAFLGLCIDYKEIPDKKSLSEVIIPKCTTK